MTMKCKICSHPRRLDIDREIVKGGNLARIAKNFDLPYNSLYNHAQSHTTRQLAQAWEKRDLEESHNLLGKIDEIIYAAEDIFRRNYEAKKDGIALKALDSKRSTIELLAKISYSLHQAKVTELELARIESGQGDYNREQEYQERLKILTDEELKMLLRLSEKLESQDPTMIILRDKPNEF